MRGSEHTRQRDRQKTAFRYWRGQVAPRAGVLLRSKGVICSALGGSLLLIAIRSVPGADLRISSVAGSLLDYAAISFGACITALVLAISLAPEQRVRTWSQTYVEGREYSTYSELLFVLSWAAMAQLAAVGTALLAILLGGDIELMPDNARSTHSAGLLIACIVATYAIWELGTVISTLSMIGAVTIMEAVHETDPQSGHSEAESSEE